MEWINPTHIEGKKKEELKKLFHSKPFPHLEIEEFLVKEKAVQLVESLTKEEFVLKESDLFKLKQTQDFGSASGLLKEFRDFLASSDFISYMEDITGLKLKRGVVDLAGSMYEDTDYLLCHDDRLEGRKIAMLFYLSELSESDGGSLNLIESSNGVLGEVTKRIVPKFGKFAFFEVSDKSFHEVSEVVVDKQRIAIGGWLHGN